MSNLEQYIARILISEGVKFEMEKSFPDLRGGRFRYDFYIPNHNGKTFFIEVDGPFHFKPIHGRQALLKQQENDRRKNSFSLAKQIPLYRIPYWEVFNLKTLSHLCSERFLVKTRWYNDEIKIPPNLK